MDFDSSSKFISSLAKFLQSLCNGYVEFNNGVEVIGHIYINVDTGKKIDYVLNEKVCKTDENSVTFISNSFHAQPAEKPKQPEKTPQLNTPETENAAGSQDEIIIMDEPDTDNFDSTPAHQEHHKPRPPKRSHNRDFSSGGGTKFSKSNMSSKHSIHNSNSVVSSDSSLSQNSSSNAAHFSGCSSMTLASGSNMDHEPKVYPVSLSESSKFHEEEKDVKPRLDDLNSVNVKQEYDYSNQGEENTELYDDSQGADYTDMQYEYYGDGTEGGQDHSHMGHDDYYQDGAGISGHGGASNPTDSTESLMCPEGVPDMAQYIRWSPGDACPVAGCKSKRILRAQLFKRHWRVVHESIVATYPCTSCSFFAKRKSDVHQHFIARHRSIFNVDKNKQVGKMIYQQNPSFVDPYPLTLNSVLGVGLGDQDRSLGYSTSRYLKGERSWRPELSCPVEGCRLNAARCVFDLKRHWKEKHEQLVAMFHCSACQYSSKRKYRIFDHYRQLHDKNIPKGSPLCIGGVEYQQNREFIDPHPLTLDAILGWS